MEKKRKMRDFTTKDRLVERDEISHELIRNDHENHEGVFR